MFRRPGASFSAVLVVASVMSASALAGTPPAPTMTELQTAYERAAAVAGSDHDADLKILGIDCSQAGGSRFTCTVGFAKTSEPGDRVYLDSALIEQRGDQGWVLLQGLCRRLL